MERATTFLGRVAGLLTRPAVMVLLIAVAALAGHIAARATPPEPVVVTQNPQPREPRGSRAPRGSVVVAPPPAQTAASGQTTATQVPCTSPAPDASATCVNGFWQTTTAGTTGGARIDRENGCVSAQPASDMICRNGLWTLRGAEPGNALDPTRAPSTQPSPTGTPANPAGSPGGAATCSSAPPPVLPTQTLTCVNGTWVVR